MRRTNPHFITSDTGDDRMSIATNPKAIAVNKNQRSMTPFNMTLLTFCFTEHLHLPHATSREIDGEQKDVPYR